ncbi:MAG: 4Fe-4S dicluster domain-containing protein [Chloroflexi bacterium]|nr:4Fe-4S dicluster domain-containing protein [Chloroflexota bacterium]
MSKWGMVIDLKRCMGCRGCQSICKVENGTQPGVFWGRVKVTETGAYPNVRKLFLPMPCMQCSDPPCKKACPSGATAIREDGIVTIDQNVCIGCRYCMVSCPYGSRFFIDEIRRYFPGHITPWEAYHAEEGPNTHLQGTVEKCQFCKHRIDEGLRKGLTPGVDREATPACVNNCPSWARTFGDLDDPNSEINKLIARRGGFQLSKELGTDPSVFYLPP